MANTIKEACSNTVHFCVWKVTKDATDFYGILNDGDGIIKRMIHFPY
jgi:hypothetical protein